MTNPKHLDKTKPVPELAQSSDVPALPTENTAESTPSEKPPTRWGKYDPVAGQPLEKPELAFNNIPYEASPNIMYRRLPGVTSICVAIPPGFKVNQEAMELLEVEYRKETGQL